jgi:FMNH2-dependent dimethyl sulfone monooxygenase
MSKLKSKLGIYVPIYGGWLRNVAQEEEVSYRNAEAAVLKAEKIGIGSIWVPDHFLNPIKGERAGLLEAWTTLTALAAVTKKVELFHTCICQGFRYPAILAKMCATLSDISNSRFQLSLGAGWFKREFEAYGVPWHEHDDRIDRSREQLEIMKGLWTEETFTYKGKYYEITNGILEPKPKKKIPIWWAGESEKSRKLTADVADGWLMRGSTMEKLRDKIVDMRKRIGEKGRSQIQYAVTGQFLIADTDKKAQEKLETILQGDKNVAKTTTETGFIGSPETVSEKINNISKLGIDYIILLAAPTIDALNIMSKKLLPIL